MIRRVTVSWGSAALLFASVAAAQSASVPVAVSVLDAAGARVPGARVTLRCDVSLSVEQNTSVDGVVLFYARPGTSCDVSAALAGFAPAARRVLVEAGPTAVELVLMPGAVTETLTVEGAGGATASVSRMSIPLMETPQAIQVLTREVLDSQQVLRTADAARNASGVTRAIRFNDAGDNYTIRGFLVDYSLKNGFKNNSLLTLTNVANVEQVEILKGPASIAYGRIEPGGVVNVVTKRPMADWHTAGQVVIDRFGLARPSIDITGPVTRSRSLLFRVNADYERRVTHRDGVTSEASFAAPALTWRMDSRTIWSIEAEYLEMHGVPDTGLPLDPISFSLPTGLNVGEPRYDAFRNRNIRSSTVVTRQIARDWLLTAAFSTLLIDADANQVGPEGPGYVSRMLLIRPGVAETSEHSESNFPRVDLTGRFRTGTVSHTVLAGVEAGWENYGIRRAMSSDVPVIDLSNSVRLPLSLPIAFHAAAGRDRRVASTGFYLQDQIALTERWRVLLGGRFDAMWLRNRERGPTGPGTPSAPDFAGPGQGVPFSGGPGRPEFDNVFDQIPEDQEARPQEITPRAGVAYYVRSDVSIYGSYARSFNPPVLNLGTTNYEPTRSRQWEGGLKVAAFGSRVQGTAAVFHIVKHGQGIGGVGRLSEVSEPSVTHRSRGFETDLQLRPIPPLNVVASYAFIAGRRMVGTVTRTGMSIFISRENLRPERLINAPPHSANVWALFQPAASRWTDWIFGGGVQYVGDRRINIAGDFSLPAHTRIDAMTAYAIDRHVKVQLNVKNLTSRTYYETDGQFGLLLPAPPVNAELSVRFSF